MANFILVYLCLVTPIFLLSSIIYVSVLGVYFVPSVLYPSFLFSLERFGIFLLPLPHPHKVGGYIHFDHSLRLQNAQGLYQILVINGYFASFPPLSRGCEELRIL